MIQKMQTCVKLLPVKYLFEKVGFFVSKVFLMANFDARFGPLQNVQGPIVSAQLVTASKVCSKFYFYSYT